MQPRPRQQEDERTSPAFQGTTSRLLRRAGGQRLHREQLPSSHWILQGSKARAPGLPRPTNARIGAEAASRARCLTDRQAMCSALETSLEHCEQAHVAYSSQQFEANPVIILALEGCQDRLCSCKQRHSRSIERAQSGSDSLLADRAIHLHHFADDDRPSAFE